MTAEPSAGSEERLLQGVELRRVSGVQHGCPTGLARPSAASEWQPGQPELEGAPSIPEKQERGGRPRLLRTPDQHRLRAAEGAGRDSGSCSGRERL